MAKGQMRGNKEAKKPKKEKAKVAPVSGIGAGEALRQGASAPKGKK